MQFDHLSLIVADMGKALTYFRTALGGTVLSHEKGSETKGTDVAFVEAGGVKFELIFPWRPGTQAHAFLQQNGPGFYHLAFAVGDLSQALVSLTAAGVQPSGAPTASKRVVQWLRREDTLGVPTHLVAPIPEQ